MTSWTSDPLTGIERTFDRDEIIVSKTDLKGRITYANQVFLRVSQYTEAELLGRPHNLIRHPKMPRGVFGLLWETIQAGDEVFAYVINRTKFGDHYWVFAHVTPTFDTRGNLIGYHSNRRVPDRDAVKEISKIYETMLREERKASRAAEAAEIGKQYLLNVLAQQGTTYGEFIFALARRCESRQTVSTT